MLKDILENKSHTSFIIFSIVTLATLCIILLAHIDSTFKIVAGLSYLVYFTSFVYDKIKTTVYFILTTLSVLILTSYTALDIDKMMAGSIGVYFPLILFNYFGVKAALSYFKVRYEYIITTSISIILILMLYFGVYFGLVSTKSTLILVSILYTIISIAITAMIKDKGTAKTDSKKEKSRLN